MHLIKTLPAWREADWCSFPPVAVFTYLFAFIQCLRESFWEGQGLDGIFKGGNKLTILKVLWQASVSNLCSKRHSWCGILESCEQQASGASVCAIQNPLISTHYAMCWTSPTDALEMRHGNVWRETWRGATHGLVHKTQWMNFHPDAHGSSCIWVRVK